MLDCKGSLTDSRAKKVAIVAAEIKRACAELVEVEKKESEIFKGLATLNTQGSPAAVQWLEEQIQGVSTSKKLLG